MLRSLTSLSVAALLATAVCAQCASVSGGTQITNWNWTFTNDDGVSVNQEPLGFNFPIAGGALAAFSHFRVGSNGWVMLTDGTNSTGIPGNTNYGSVAAMGGALGDFPLVCPFWGDLYWSAGATNGVFVSQVPGVSCRISWSNVRDFGSAVTPYSYAVELFVTGEVRLHYGSNVQNVSTQNFTNYVGVSARNGIAPPAAVDFWPGPSAATSGMIWQGFAPAAFDGSGSSQIMVPFGLGWGSTACTGAPSSNTAYGTGCYTVPGSGAYQLFTDAALASAGLQGNAILIAKTGTGYTSAWLPGAAAALFVPPTPAAVALPISDDGDFLYTPTIPLSTPAGPVSQLRISSNGIITLGAAANHGGDWTPTGPEFAAAPAAAFYCWHDWNTTETGSGLIKTEQIGNNLYITWDGVESYSNPVALNPGTMQWHFNLLTGDVTATFTQIDTNTTSAFGSGYLLGFRGQYAVPDNGTQNLTVPATVAYGFAPVALAASPAPVVGTTVTYTTRNAPEIVPGSGLYVGLQILSTTQDLAGVDLGIIGAPGCNVHVQTLDVTASLVGPLPVMTYQFAIPVTAPTGISIFAQTAVLITPGTVGGQNPGGVLTSNAINSFINFF